MTQLFDQFYNFVGTDINHFPIFTIVTLFLGAFIIAIVGKLNKTLRNVIVFIVTIIPFLLMLSLIKPIMIDGGVINYWMGNWAPVGEWAIGIGLEVDALSLFFGLIVTLAVFIVAIYSFTYMNRDSSLENYYTLFLMLSGALLGLVLTGDLFNIFVMIEIMTMTEVALTAFRVDYDGALEGAMKYMVVGSLGSSTVLVGIAMLYSQLHTLNLAQIAASLPSHQNAVTAAAFAFLFIGFASKAFLFPFHPLEADVNAVAPASISMIISGVITKCGVYAIIRICYILFQNIELPAVSISVTLLGAVSCFICVTMAFNQHNFRRLLAYHSISQIGYVIMAVGLGSMFGLEAGLFHAVNHTLFKGLLFLTAGAVQYATGSADLDKLGGLVKKMPQTCALFLIGAASISGLPPFNGFASKWMIYQSVFEKASETGNFVYVIVVVVCLLCSVLTLASFIKVAQSVFFGQLNPEFNKPEVHEVPVVMQIPMWILAGLCVLFGVFPNFIQKYFLTPAATAAFNVTNYIDTMLGQGTAAKAGIQQTEIGTVSSIGCWQPVSWLWLLLIITCAVCLIAVLGSNDNKKHATALNAEEKVSDLVGVKQSGAGRLNNVAADASLKGVASDHLLSDQELIIISRDRTIEDEVLAGEDPKYENFFSGEKSEFSQVGGSDLFWGFKHDMRHYFNFQKDWHSGNVNDYTTYGVAAIAVTLVLAILFL